MACRPIPSALVAAVRPYTEIRSAAFRSWHPARREMLITTRFGETDQVHRRRSAGRRSPPAHVPPRADRLGELRPARRQLVRLLERRGRRRVLPALPLRPRRRPDHAAHRRRQAARRRPVVEPRRSARVREGRRRRRRRVHRDLGDRSSRAREQAQGRHACAAAAGASPTGRSTTPQLLLREQVSESESSLWLIDVATGAQRRVTPEPGTTDVAAGAPDASPPTARRSFVTTDLRGEFRQLAALRIADGELEILTRRPPVGRHRGRAGRRTGRRSRVRRQRGRAAAASTCSTPRPAQAARDRRAARPGVADGLRWHENENDLALTVSSARISGDVFVVDAHERQGRALDPQRDRRPRSGELRRAHRDRVDQLRRPPDHRPALSTRLGALPRAGARSSSTSTAVPKVRRDRAFAAPPTTGPPSSASPSIYPNVRGSLGYGKTFVDLDNGFAARRIVRE